jgi:N-acetylglucosamine kinase-like BadF-type ATPase
MKYYIGLDGGGTKTKCVLADENLKIITESNGGPSNFLMLGTDTVSETIFNVISECLEGTSVKMENIGAVVLGSTGAGRRSDAEQLEKAFIFFTATRGINFEIFRVESDARIALEGAFSGKPGSILIAGTGSIMFGKDAKSNIHRVGGFGRFIGDEGSGYILGKHGLTAVAKHYDGRGKKTILADILKDKFEIDEPSQLITQIYKKKFDIAAVAPFVIKAADKDDAVCNNILEQQSDELIDHILAMKRMLNEKTLRLSLIGSTIATNNVYSRMLKEKVKKRCKDCTIVKPELPPALGAIVMAKNLALK